MTNISVFGKGNMGSAIKRLFEAAGQSVSVVTKEEKVTELGDIVVLAVPYAAVDSIINEYKDQLKGKVIVDITNPVNFDTLDGLVVPAHSSAAQVIADKLPGSAIVKAFNTNFASTLNSKKVGENPTTLLVAGSDEAKSAFSQALQGSGIEIIDAGSLKRARELEAMGFLQISLAVREQISWANGFAVIK